MKRLMLLLVGVVPLAGCAAVSPSSSCDVTGYQFTVSPGTATANHLATAPANQQKFTATSQETIATSAGELCAVPEVIAIVDPIWTNPEPLNISISSAADETNGTAVCTGSTGGPVTLTASYAIGQKAYTATAALTCE